jgi:pimeloyl-ACP methyl ester carboxylesterase
MTDVRLVPAGGIRLAYRESGPASAPPLLLLHALGENSADWDRVAAALAESWHVYALDLRGRRAPGARGAARQVHLGRGHVSCRVRRAGGSAGLASGGGTVAVAGGGRGATGRRFEVRRHGVCPLIIRPLIVRLLIVRLLVGEVVVRRGRPGVGVIGG